ncbi:MAG: hypothetical protein IKF91_00350 [Bacilli bacterium]|nr:hypothetical protein [Bacilli bacterium]
MCIIECNWYSGNFRSPESILYGGKTRKNTNDTILAGDSLKTYNDYKDAYNYGNDVSKNDYLTTKIKMNYRMIYPGHDSVIINGIIMDRKKLKEF